ncbi:MAG: DUF815 domain-containing protein, partial [Lachnospiraceae bacterium]|nr:DUF815 domain-containing protein [Lachnospiraceae bacterium]
MILDELLLFSVPKTSAIYRMYVEVTKDDATDRNSEVIGECIREMINNAYRIGLMGDIWRLSLTHLLVNSENPYSLSCERDSTAGESLTEFALHDVAIIRRLYGVKLDGEFDFGTIFSAYDRDVFRGFMNYDQDRGRFGAYSQAVRWQLNELSESLLNAGSDEEFLGHLTQFYHRYGVGELGLHKAFRVGNDGAIEPIQAIPEVSFDTLVGCEEQKRELINNTKAFLAGMPANNVLLYGEAGTGKSTSIKALTNMFYEEGLRIIEIYKHQFPYISNIISKL